MAVYTELSKPFLKELADDYGLGRVTGATGIPEGSVNTNYVLEAAKGKFLLRVDEVKGEKGDRASESESETDLMKKSEKLALRLQAEEDAKQKETLYRVTLADADKALAAKNLELAQAKYQQAGKLFTTDTVLTGLRNIDAVRAQVTLPLREPDA